LTIRDGGRRAFTPFAVVIVVILLTDVIVAIDSVPAGYGITGDPCLVFVTNAAGAEGPWCRRSRPAQPFSSSS
jgi:predicted tellurium resistance membrane protein TerC